MPKPEPISARPTANAAPRDRTAVRAANSPTTISFANSSTPRRGTAVSVDCIRPWRYSVPRAATPIRPANSAGNESGPTPEEPVSRLTIVSGSDRNSSPRRISRATISATRAADATAASTSTHVERIDRRRIDS